VPLPQTFPELIFRTMSHCVLLVGAMSSWAAPYRHATAINCPALERCYSDGWMREPGRRR
jgi:hypothetical protein